jgi:2'-5' RNA ligase
VEAIRTFIAIELDADVRKVLTEVQEQLKAQGTERAVRWVAPEGIHITLKFLGNIAANRVEEVNQAVTTACRGFRPFELSFAVVGCFPNTRRPNVVWIGVEGDTATLVQLERSVEDTLAAIGFPREEREFTPHLTLGRVRREAKPADRQRVGEAVQKTTVGTIGAMRVTRVSVMRSELKPSGAEYTRLAAIDLVG